MKDSSSELIAVFSKFYHETGKNRFSSEQYTLIDNYETAINELIRLNVIEKDTFIDAGISFTKDFLDQINS